jgi:hypothetical protein
MLFASRECCWIYPPRLAIAIIELLIFLTGRAVTLKGVMSKHFAIYVALLHLYLHLQNLDMGQFLEMHQRRALDIF